MVSFKTWDVESVDEISKCIDTLSSWKYTKPWILEFQLKCKNEFMRIQSDEYELKSSTEKYILGEIYFANNWALMAISSNIV